MSNDLANFLGLIVAALCGVIIGVIFTGSCSRQDEQKKAIKAGAAEYYIDTNTFEREFRYLPAK